MPEVHVTAKAFLPSTSLVTFELGNGLNFTTFVSTCPISGGWVWWDAGVMLGSWVVRTCYAQGWGPLADHYSAVLFAPWCPAGAANKTVNRFALVRKLSSDKTGIFNSRLWDGMARR